MNSIKLVFECASSQDEVVACMITSTLCGAIGKFALLLPDPIQGEAQQLMNLFGNAEIRSVEPAQASNIIIV